MSKTLSLHYPPVINDFFPLKSKFKFGILRNLIIISITALLVAYIFQINAIIQKTYFVKNYEKELSVLAEDNTNLESNVYQANSLGATETRIKDLNYEQIGSIKYLQVLEPQVVSK